MVTTTETVEFGHYPLQVRPAPLRLKSWGRREGIILAPPPSRESSLQSTDKLSEKADPDIPPADRGSGAWRYLFAASMIEGFMFGMPLEARTVVKLTKQAFHSTMAFSKTTTTPTLHLLVTTIYLPLALWARASISLVLRSLPTSLAAIHSGSDKPYGLALPLLSLASQLLDGPKTLDLLSARKESRTEWES